MSFLTPFVVMVDLEVQVSNMKYLFVLMVFIFSGCASISEYNQGCRDGVKGVLADDSSRDINKYCDGLDVAHREKERLERQGNRK